MLIGVLTLWVINQGYSQINYSVKVESGFLYYQYHIINIDPGPNWKGYNLESKNGIDLNFINGFNFKNKFYAGIGIGYLNFESVCGLSIFSDFDYFPIKSRLTPLINMRIG